MGNHRFALSTADVEELHAATVPAIPAAQRPTMH
jgi:hypothetical protein